MSAQGEKKVQWIASLWLCLGRVLWAKVHFQVAHPGWLRILSPISEWVLSYWAWSYLWLVVPLRVASSQLSSSWVCVPCKPSGLPAQPSSHHPGSEAFPQWFDSGPSVMQFHGVCLFFFKLCSHTFLFCVKVLEHVTCLTEPSFTFIFLSPLPMCF